ncbi:MAG: alpha/beta hydrolase [Gemmatimonadota bacterium]
MRDQESAASDEAPPVEREPKSASAIRSENEGLLSLDTGAGVFSTLVSGRGPALLLLHGLTASRAIWEPVISLLSGRYRIVAPDLPGRGVSRAPPGQDYSMRAELSRLVAMIRMLGLERPLIVGHSYGAALALALAGAEGATRYRPSGLLLLSPVTPWTPRPSLLPVLTAGVARPIVVPLAQLLRRPLTRYVLEKRVLGNGRIPSRRLVDDFSAAYARRERVEALLDVLGDWRPSDLMDWMSEIPIPVRVLAGGQDRRITAAETRRLSARLGAPLRFVPGAGHGLPLDAPFEVRREIDRLQDYTRQGDV